jgi:hypothetical protein
MSQSGWPAGTEDGRGGQFRPKDASELTQKVKSLIARRALRTGLLAALRIGIEGLGNLIPGVDVAADVMMVADIARTVSEFGKLAIDAAAALDFVREGPHSFDDLQVSSSYEEFLTYREFVKDGLSPGLMLKMYGSAGEGNQYHHIVTQGGLNEKNIPPEQLQNTDNIIRLPTLLHEAVNAAYLIARFQGSRGTFASQDRMAQGHALLRGFDLVKELDRLKSEGTAALTRLVGSDVLVSSNERAASLIRGFEFGAKLADVLYDELLDTDGKAKVLRLIDVIVLALNDIHPGRAALTALFDHPDAGVRV